jgi:hypothetical protein
MNAEITEILVLLTIKLAAVATLLAYFGVQP